MAVVEREFCLVPVVSLPRKTPMIRSRSQTSLWEVVLEEVGEVASPVPSHCWTEIGSLTDCLASTDPHFLQQPQQKQPFGMQVVSVVLLIDHLRALMHSLL